MKRQHKHAALIQQWLDDDSLKVECYSAESMWEQIKEPSWNEKFEYRFKPRMIKCGDLEFPEPMRFAPEYGSNYYVVGILTKRYVNLEIWRGGATERYWLDRGLCHATEESAEAHAKALIALTEVK